MSKHREAAINAAVDAAYLRVQHGTLGEAIRHALDVYWSKLTDCPIGDLAGRIPVVLYFASDNDAAEFAEVARQQMSNPVEVRLP